MYSDQNKLYRAHSEKICFVHNAPQHVVVVGVHYDQPVRLLVQHRVHCEALQNIQSIKIN